MSYCLYILECADQHRYVGYTADLQGRLQEHQSGQVPATRHRRPVQLVYWELHSTRAAAFRREQQLKNGRTRASTISKLISQFMRSTCHGFNSRSDLHSLTLRKSRAH